MIIDRQYVFIGSSNIDPRSKTLNTEIGIMVNSRELAMQARELFNRATSPENSYRLSMNGKLSWLTKENTAQQRYTSEPGAGYLRKTGVFLLSLLPFESLL
jgi:putative cardiolipin synthase